jgi:hypothetical protein
MRRDFLIASVRGAACGAIAGTAIVLLLVMGGCGNPDSSIPPKPKPVVRIATAPDGTVLWRAWDDQRFQWIYFPSSGAQFSVSSGNVRRDVAVPTAVGDDNASR